MFGAWVGWIAKTFDYINRVVIMLPLLVYESTWTHSPLSLLCITMILCVRRKYFEITTFPNINMVLNSIYYFSMIYGYPMMFE